jgi:hypothetical protein
VTVHDIVHDRASRHDYDEQWKLPALVATTIEHLVVFLFQMLDKLIN